MPDRNWPPRLRLAAQLIRCAMYAFATLAGSAVLHTPPPTGGDVHPGWAVAFGAAGIVAGTVAFVGAAAHRWQVEWVAVCFVGAAFNGYSLLELVAGDPAMSAALAVAGFGAWSRGIDLTVFSLTASHARKARVRSWRRAAGLDR